MALSYAARLLLATVLLGSSVAYAQIGFQHPIGDDGKTTYTGRARESNTLVFGNQMVAESMALGMTTAVKGLVNGRLNFAPPAPKNVPIRDVQVSCLNSVAPAPLNWKMWCPGKDASVKEYTDSAGARHRIITLNPQKGMTSTMAIWFISWYSMGLGAPIVEYKGKHYYYYHLWHPLDHVESAIKLAPAIHQNNRGIPLYALIHERYRNPKNFKGDRHFETNGWFFVEDAMGNLLKNRFVVDMNLMGLNLWTLFVDFIDTDQGLVVRAEVVGGSPNKGYDAKDPLSGSFLAATMNDMFTGSLFSGSAGISERDVVDSIDAITRHTIEEFSNLRHFVPYLYERNTITGKVGINLIPTLGTFLNHANLTAKEAPAVSAYNLIVNTIQKLPSVNTTNTPLGQKTIAVADTVAAHLSGNLSAFHSGPTPSPLVHSPKWKSESQLLDSIMVLAKGDSVTSKSKSNA